MIQVYSEWNTDYDHNGDAVFDPISCTVNMELNGAWEMTLEVPLDEDGRFQLLVINAVISAPTPIGDNQLFRIYETERTDDSAIAYARPIFMDAARDVFLVDTRPTNMTGQEALDYLMDGTPYSGTSNIELQMTAYYVRKNLIEALAGGEDNSFISRWGGEILYDNYHVDISVRQGADNGLRVEFGRNIESINEQIDVDSMATRIVPVAYNGRTLAGDEPWVDSPRINDYPIVYTKEVEFSNIRLIDDVVLDDEGDTDTDADVYDTIEELRAALVEQCEALFEDGIDLPAITYQIDMIDLARTDEYADYKVLETVNLGDTAHCYHRILGIETEARIIALTFDCILKSITSITIGDYVDDYWSNINASISSAATAVDFDSLATKIAYIESNYIKTYELEAEVASFGFLTANEAEITYAKITDLDAALITVNELLAGYVKADELYADIAQFGFLTADSAVITSLTAFAETAYVLLGGTGSFGELESIHLTVENTVIDQAVIEQAVAGTILADLIYADYINTDVINIMSDNGGITIIGNQMQFTNGQIQFYDEDGNLRLQIGQDETGNFTFELYSADGSGVMIDENGIHESAITDGLIIDRMVADDANISGYKLNIEEICSIINNGTYTIEAGSVTIDGQGLDVWYAEINEAINGLEGMTTEGLTGIVRYYCYWGSDTDAPPEDSEVTPAICGEAVCGLTVCGLTEGNLWQIEPISALDGVYRWCKLLGSYQDGHTEWGLPYCLDDGVTREQTQVLQTELTVVQGLIDAKVWETDIESYVDPIYGEISTLTDNYAYIRIEVDGISEQVASVTTIEAEHYLEMSSQIGEIQVASDEISMRVSDVEQNMEQVGYTLDELEEKLSSIEGLERWIPYWCLWDSGTEAPPDDEDLTPAICGEATCGLTVCGVTDGVLWKEDEPPTQDGLYEWVKIKLIYQNGDIEWWGPYCISDVYVRSQIDAVWAQFIVLDDRITATVADLQQTIDGDYESMQLAISNVEQTAYQIQSTVADLEIELGESVTQLYSQITQTATEILTEVSDVENGLTSQIDQLSDRITTEVSDMSDFVQAQLAATTEWVEDQLKNIDGLKSWKPYWCLWGSATSAPPADEDLTAAICGTAVCGLTVCGVTDGTLWKEEQPVTEYGLYLWVKYWLEYEDGTTGWYGPYCLTDEYAREQLEGCYSRIEQLSDSITATVVDLTNEFESQITQTASEIRSEINDTKDGLGSEIQQLASSISMKVTSASNGTASIVLSVDGEDVGSGTVVDSARTAFQNESTSCTISAGVITFNSGTLVINSTNFTLTSAGAATFSGTLSAPSGNIGGWTIGTNSLYNGCSSMTSTTTGTYIGTDGIRQYASSSAYVNIQNGVITAVGASISGTITATTLSCTNGTIGGWNISGTGIYSGTTSMTSTTVGTFIGPTGFRQYASSSAYVNIQDGVITAYGANISGAITATTLTCSNGTIGGWTIGTSSLYNGTDSLTSTTNGMYLGTNGIRNYNGGDYLNITSGYIENGNSEGSYARLYSGSLRLTYQGTLLGAYNTNYWMNDSSKRGLNINLEYEADYIAFGRKSSSDATVFSSAYLINWNIGSSAVSYSERHIFYGTARFADYLYTNRVYPGSNNDTYYITSQSISSTLRGIYTNGTFATGDAVYVGNALYGSYGTYMLNVNGASYLSGTLTVTGAVSLSSTLAVSGTSTLTGAVTTGSTITASGNIYAGSSSDTSARAVYARNSYGSVYLYVATGSTANRGLVDATNNVYYAFWSGTNSRYVFGNSSYPTYIQGSTISGLNAIATLAEYDVDDISTLSSATFRDPNHEVVTHVNSHTYKVDGKKHLGLTVNELESAMKDAGMDPDEYDITDRVMDEDGNEHGAIRYDELIPMLFSEIQSLNERVAALEN